MTICTTFTSGETNLIIDAGMYFELDCGECEGKVTQLTLKYMGSTVDAHIEVIQKKDDVKVFDGIVQPDEDFTFNGVWKGGTTLGTEIIIKVNGVEHTRIHTSCSEPIGLGLVSGDFKVVEGYSLNGGLLCPL